MLRVAFEVCLQTITGTKMHSCRKADLTRQTKLPQSKSLSCIAKSVRESIFHRDMSRSHCAQEHM